MLCTKFIYLIIYMFADGFVVGCQIGGKLLISTEQFLECVQRKQNTKLQIAICGKQIIYIFG